MARFAGDITEKDGWPFRAITKVGQYSEKAWALEDKALVKLEKSGNVVSFSVADGYAYYLVTKRTPLTLKFIPYSDQYQIDPAYIRGLRVSDIDRQRV